MKEKDIFIEWVASMNLVLNKAEKDISFVLGMSEKDIKIAKSYFEKLINTYSENK